ncbi:MAG: AmmeMemoRadiSam system protein A [Acidobacteria bacterium]|nr:AmmeMemoRadiSam system protein A [Acidobacteriota bacterium]
MHQPLSEHDQQRLLTLARRALEARIRRQPPPRPERGGALEWPRGAFVTIYCRGDLRGCLGRIETEAPLADTIAHLAASVSDSDPRFDPVSALELAGIDVEISVLTPEREIHSIAEIEIGRHGLIVERGARRGLLLPQVAIAYGWDAQTFVSHTCLKAALPADAWRHGVRMLVFEAQVFGDSTQA